MSQEDVCQPVRTTLTDHPSTAPGGCASALGLLEVHTQVEHTFAQNQ